MKLKPNLIHSLDTHELNQMPKALKQANQEHKPKPSKPSSWTDADWDDYQRRL